jgi:hypothetical protein
MMDKRLLPTAVSWRKGRHSPLPGLGTTAAKEPSDRDNSLWAILEIQQSHEI